MAGGSVEFDDGTLCQFAEPAGVLVRIPVGLSLESIMTAAAAREGRAAVLRLGVRVDRRRCCRNALTIAVAAGGADPANAANPRHRRKASRRHGRCSTPPSKGRTTCAHSSPGTDSSRGIAAIALLTTSAAAPARTTSRTTRRSRSATRRSCRRRTRSSSASISCPRSQAGPASRRCRSTTPRDGPTLFYAVIPITAASQLDDLALDRHRRPAGAHLHARSTRAAASQPGHRLEVDVREVRDPLGAGARPDLQRDQDRDAAGGRNASSTRSSSSRCRTCSPTPRSPTRACTPCRTRRSRTPGTCTWA